MNLKVVNKGKFVRSILIIFAVILVISFMIGNISLSHTDTTYKTILVSNGDTLWSVAKEQKEKNLYYENKDVRDIVSDIKTLNKLNNSDLSINQELIIPCI